MTYDQKENELSEKDTKTIGVVDIGSNSTRLSIYRCENGSSRLLLNKKRMTGLAQYVKNGVLTREGIREAVGAVRSFKQLLFNLDVREMYIFATASLRNVSNSFEAAKAIEDAVGVNVDVISGEEEGDLSFYGAMRSVSIKTGILIDLGGGSTEIVHFENGRITESYSLPLGSLSLFRQYVSGLWPENEELSLMKKAVKAQLNEQETEYTPAEDICGVGGTVRAVCRLVNEVYDRPEDCREFTFDELESIYRIIKKGGSDRKKLLIKIVPDRLHTIMPGIVILRTIMKTFGSKRVQVSAAGVREGYLLKKVFSAS